MLREMTQAVEIDGAKYQVRKMDVISATYLLKFLTQKLLPVFTEAQKLFLPEEAPASAKKSRKKQNDNGADAFVALLPKLLDAISEEDLHHIIVVPELLRQVPSGRLAEGHDRGKLRDQGH